jgi:hypothetical protein
LDLNNLVFASGVTFARIFGFLTAPPSIVVGVCGLRGGSWLSREEENSDIPPNRLACLAGVATWSPYPLEVFDMSAEDDVVEVAVGELVGRKVGGRLVNGRLDSGEDERESDCIVVLSGR